MAHRKWKEAKQQPGTAGPGNMLGSCLVSFHFLWVNLSPQAVCLVSSSHVESQLGAPVPRLVEADAARLEGPRVRRGGVEG